MSEIFFSKLYDCFALADLHRDLTEAFDPSFNEAAIRIPQDGSGSFRVSIKYVPEWECECVDSNHQTSCHKYWDNIIGDK